MTCTATLTTATVEPCPDPENGCDADECYGPIGAPRHVTLHTLKCDGDTDLADHTQGNHHCDGVWWHDDTHGATPHADPLVTDEMIEAAWAARVGETMGGYEDWRVVIAAALDAAPTVSGWVSCASEVTP